MGIPGTGAPVHYHSNTAWNGLVYGTKAWVLAPPPNATFSNIPASKKVFDLAEHEEEGSRKFRCVQYGGDVLLAPPYWGHLTYNLATSIGMAKEFVINPPPHKIMEFSQLKRKGGTASDPSPKKKSKASNEKADSRSKTKPTTKKRPGTAPGKNKKTKKKTDTFDFDEL